MDAIRREAAYYEKRKEGLTRCGLCPQACGISEGSTGICRTRTTSGTRLELLNYGEYTSLGMDPIEKKPLYHFYPGWDILSIGGRGCNLTCDFCQNCEISQGDAPTRQIEPEQLAAEVENYRGRSIGIAFTYNEPFIWFEFIRDTAPLVKKNGQKIVLVTNGFVNPEPLRELLPYIDAMNVDLKSFDDEFYRKYCGGSVAPVKDTISAAAAAGVWIEVTLLLIPSLNDNPDMLRAQAEWIASISKNIPFHISRYHPCHKLDLPPTPLNTLKRAWEIASEHLNYAYLGNVGEPEFGRTSCPGCGNLLIERLGYNTRTPGLEGEKCANCGAEIAVVRGHGD
jgi:pyruvate formate lyase activating enzyme